MPIYEFRCSSCGHEFEELILGAGEMDELVCPRCGAEQITQLLSSFASRGSAKSEGGAAAGAGCDPGSFT